MTGVTINMDSGKTAWVLGAGLAGCEAAWQLACRGVRVRLLEMKPERYSPAHTYPGFAELVCSNSLKAARLGSAAGLLCMWNCKRFSTPGWRTTFSLTAFLISISTVFLKQHSIIDVVTAIPICVITGWIVYGKKLKLR